MLRVSSLTLSLKHCLLDLITVQNFKDTYLKDFTSWNNLISSVYEAVIFVSTIFRDGGCGGAPVVERFLSLRSRSYMRVLHFKSHLKSLDYCKQCRSLIAVINRNIAADYSDALLWIRPHFINPYYRTARSAHRPAQGFTLRTNFYLTSLVFL